ncbi:low-density lipoprotein receptor-related protein 4-like [Dendronephthya gigantea]|uniref:low-density lipoprotein receptor-related protein 4-like n=1 Tax=Dendronephthya gigantea TaxID=151771 RepID=UPI00106B4CD0|nr:low-density lipoprotein receptor-related protein 4-like [Dendronephthya gigantea]
MNKMAFVSTKMLFALKILIYFGGNLINCNEDIPICDKQLKKLKEDVKNWEKRCVNESLKNLDDIERYFTESQLYNFETQQYFNERRRENNSPGCTTERKYLQERMRMHSKMCFYDGPYPEQYMFLASDTAILVVDLTTLDSTVVVNGKGNISRLDIDMKNKKIYFADNRQDIRRANYDGTYEEIVVTDARTWGLTIDWIGRRIFWGDPWKQTIEVATLDGKDSRKLIKTLQPFDLAIDPIDGYLFWTPFYGRKVIRRHLATNNDKQIYGFNRSSKYSLALDYNRKRVYAYGLLETANVIIGMDYDGLNSNPTTNYSSPVFNDWMSVDVVGNFLYWKERLRISPMIIKMNATSRNISRYIPLPKGFDVRKLLVVDKYRQRQGKFVHSGKC